MKFKKGSFLKKLFDSFEKEPAIFTIKFSVAALLIAAIIASILSCFGVFNFDLFLASIKNTGLF